MTQDEQEAQSIRYVVGLRVGRLRSGAWVLVVPLLDGGLVTEVHPDWPQTRVEALAEAELADREAWDQRQEARLARQRQAETAESAEEMGL